MEPNNQLALDGSSDSDWSDSDDKSPIKVNPFQVYARFFFKKHSRNLAKKPENFYIIISKYEMQITTNV